jgi:hypothetical protein
MHIWLRTGNQLAAQMEPKKSWDRIQEENEEEQKETNTKLDLKRTIDNELRMGILKENENEIEGFNNLRQAVGDQEKLKELILPVADDEIEENLSEEEKVEIEKRERI